MTVTQMWRRLSSLCWQPAKSSKGRGAAPLLYLLAFVLAGLVASDAEAGQTPTDLYATADALAVYPSPPASGDTLSLSITAHNGGSRPLRNIQAAVYLRTEGEDRLLTEATLPGAPPRGTANTVVDWTWDTQGLTGPQTLVVHLDPKDLIQQGDENAANNVAQVTVDLEPPPADEAGVQWAKADSVCCTFHYLTHSAAERDLDAIKTEADEAHAFVEQALGIQATRKMDVYLVPRTIGHGGFAMGYLVLSYHDRHYPNGRFREVMRHEATHGLQEEWARGDSITMMAEGLAVWTTGGHFKPEPVRERAAALLAINQYIPFDQLVNDFYDKQHETGYIEAAGFIQYLAETYGQDKLAETFRSLQRGRGERDYTVLDRALNKVFGKGAADMETEYRAWLAATTPDPTQERDLADTILFFDTVRRYQAALDPTAYFRTPWMPNIQEAERRGLVADYMRHPETGVNLALETMLLDASEAQYAGDYDAMEAMLGRVTAILDAHEANPASAWAALFSEPVAASYLEAVQAAQARGYEPQRVEVDGDQAAIWATRGPEDLLYRLTARERAGGWQLLEWVFRGVPDSETG